MFGSTVIIAAYIAFAIATIAVFIWRPPLQAVLITSFLGWMALPVGPFPPKAISPDGFTMEIIGTALPSNLLLTKALVVPVVVLLCLVVRAPRLLQGFRVTVFDAAIALFCLTPLLSGVAGKVPLASALVQSAYLAGVWGGTWMTGRLVLCNSDGRQALIAATAMSGLFLLPAAILEGLRPAWLYLTVYGPHPFFADGTTRYLGFRPLAFFEHGNQYGIWIAMAALAAVARAMRRKPRSQADLAVAAVLVACAIASQSIGAIILLMVGWAWIVVSKGARRIALAAVALLLATAGTAYLSGKVPLRSWALETSSGQAVAAGLRIVGRQSLGWRIQRDQRALEMIHDAPLTGHGTWDWWRPVQTHPWGLPLLIAGQFGLLALALASFALLGGALRGIWHGSASVLPAIAVLAAADAWLNSAAYLPAILAAAAMAQPFWRRSPKLPHSADAPNPQFPARAGDGDDR